MDELGNFAEWIGDKLGVVDLKMNKLTEAVENYAKASTELLSKQNSEWDYNIKLAAASGKSTVDAETAKQEAIKKTNTQLALNLLYLQASGKELTEEQKKQLETFKQGAIDAGREIALIQAKSDKEAKEKRQEAYEDWLALEKKKIQDWVRLDKELSEIKLAGAAIDKENREMIAKDVANDKDKFDQKAADADYEAGLKKKEDDKKKADEELALKNQTMADAFMIERAAVESSQSLSDAFFAIKRANTKNMSAEDEAVAKKQFQVNKALSIAATIVSGYQGATAALARPVLTPLGYAANVANAISIGVAAAANVAKIAATQFNTAGFASSVKAEVPKTPSTRGEGSNTPRSQSLPQRGQDSTQFDESGNRVTKVVVLASDIKDVTRSVARVEEQAKF
jgi:hypothetical protein